MTITDTTTGESLRVSRTYRTTDGEALLHVTPPIGAYGWTAPAVRPAT